MDRARCMGMQGTVVMRSLLAVVVVVAAMGPVPAIGKKRLGASQMAKWATLTRFLSDDGCPRFCSSAR